ncbi:MAG: flippase-like domain-containing protein [Bifidobacteriaceae bacterium]|nr:flippase-like domain-containing protein [Bifidobacteriaceae bacterium]
MAIRNTLGSLPHLPGRGKEPIVASTVVEGVEVVDAPVDRTRQPKDLVGLVICAVGIAFVIVLSTYAQATTAGITEDVRSITHVVYAILQAVVQLLMGVATLVLPLVVLIDMLVRRQWRLTLDGVVATVVGYGIGFGAIWVINLLGRFHAMQPLMLWQSGHSQAAISPFAVAVAALLTTVGPRSRRSVLATSWNVLWVALVAEIITLGTTLPAAIVTVMLGRLVGDAARYVLGVSTDRASSAQLVAAVRKVGLDPARIVRVRDISDPESPTQRLDVHQLRAVLRGEAPIDPATEPDVLAQVSADPAALALERQGGNRVYAIYDAAGKRWDAIVLDADRQVIGFVSQTWRALRLRGMDRRSSVSLRQAAERAALLDYAVAAADVRTPQMVGIGEAQDSMVLVQEHPEGLRSLRDMRASEISDGDLAEVWRQLRKAHDAGLAHRDITEDTVLLGPGPAAPVDAVDAGAGGGVGAGRVWLIGWEGGDVASSDLARHLDVVQLLTLLTLKVGAERAVASAARVFEPEELGSMVGLLQTIALPRQTAAQVKEHKAVFDELRAALLALVPEAAAGGMFKLVRFGWRTVLLIVLVIVALWALFVKANFGDIVTVIKQSNPWWMAGSFLFGFLTFVGAALAMMGFSPVKLPLKDTLLTQVGASFVAVAIPAGIGPAALNLRLLTKRKVKTSIAVASVSLAQIALFFTTLLLLIVLSLVAGDTGVLRQLPSKAVLIVLIVVVVIAVAIVAPPPVRRWVWTRIGPTLKQVWPRVLWILTQPKKLVLGLGGQLIQSVGYVLAFWCSLEAFGVHKLSPINIALCYFIATTVGAMVPIPGNIGSAEAALTGGLKLLGIPAVVGLPTSTLFRALTYWARVPFGWFAFRYLQRRDVV